MSRRPTVQVESDSEGSDAGSVGQFDDDTDLPLPGASTSTGRRSALPNTGARGALLEEILPIETTKTYLPTAQPQRQTQPAKPPTGPSSSGVGSAGVPQGLGGFDQSHPLYQKRMAADRASGINAGMIDPKSADMEKYKKWTCIYPIYIDAKRAYGTGLRRIAREKSVWWPRSQEITAAVASMGLPTLHEHTTSHPRDWENPGRVRVLWKKDGRLTNPSIPTKKKLFEMVARHIQQNHPGQIPDMSTLSLEDESEVQPQSAPPPGPGSGKAAKTSNSNSRSRQRRRPPLPKPPLPLPPLEDRISIFSPLISSGALLEGWKVSVPGAGEKGAPGAGVPGAPGAGSGKPKRKIIRIRQ